MSNDKKKLVVLGALGVVIVAVGAFQMMSSGQPAPVKVAENKGQKTEYAPDTDDGTINHSEDNSVTAEYAGDKSANETDPLKGVYASNLSVRDPFDVLTTLPGAPEISSATPPAQQNVPPQTTRKPWRGGSEMSIPPMPPLSGTLEPNGPDGEPGPILPTQPSGPQYSVSGVIRGSENAVVISDSQGNQRLIKEGHEIDGDAKVVSVQKNKVVIRKKDGKTITLSVGGNPK